MLLDIVYLVGIKRECNFRVISRLIFRIVPDYQTARDHVVHKFSLQLAATSEFYAPAG